MQLSSHKKYSGAIVLGDSFNNTLGLIRSIGEAHVPVCLILEGNDRLFISHSRYVTECYHINTLDDAPALLADLYNTHQNYALICSNDKAALLVDSNEATLSALYHTPMRGKALHHLFDKDAQCALAEKCGFTVPQSAIYTRGNSFPTEIQYPLLIKPANSNCGEKSDIHICRDTTDLNKALSANSICETFIVQEFIEKDYEINMIGISTDREVIVPGGIKKLRHYPNINGPCSFGRFMPAENLGVDIEPIRRFITESGYRGPFSVELLRKGNNDYFMEFNFRHDGLAYSATASGANLMKGFFGTAPIGKVRPTYMMDLSVDFMHVKNKHISFTRWIGDFIRTGCQLNFNIKDPRPTLNYYKAKILRN